MCMLHFCPVPSAEYPSLKHMFRLTAGIPLTLPALLPISNPSFENPRNVTFPRRKEFRELTLNGSGHYPDLPPCSASVTHGTLPRVSAIDIQKNNPHLPYDAQKNPAFL